MHAPVFRLVLMLVAGTGVVRGQGVVLNAGDTWTYHFTSLDYVNTQPIPGRVLPFGATFSFDYTINTYPPWLVYDLFESVPTDGRLGGSTQPVGQMGILLPTSAWQDLEGSVRLTVTEGSFTINSLTFTVWRPNASEPSNFDTFQTTVVPEPTTLALLGAFSVLAICRRRGKSIFTAFMKTGRFLSTLILMLSLMALSISASAEEKTGVVGSAISSTTISGYIDTSIHLQASNPSSPPQHHIPSWRWRFVAWIGSFGHRQA